MATKAPYTKKELAEFDRLTLLANSSSNRDRVLGRLRLNKFVAEHGKDKCNAMHAELTKGKKN